VTRHGCSPLRLHAPLLLLLLHGLRREASMPSDAAVDMYNSVAFPGILDPPAVFHLAQTDGLCMETCRNDAAERQAQQQQQHTCASA
jgi:hypothetical protein